MVAELRNWRMQVEGRKRSNGEDGLYRKLTRLITAHRMTYPDLSPHNIASVILRVHNDQFAETA